MSTFTVAGVSTQHGITKVRFANDLTSRVKLLAKGGHNPLELIELPSAMTKDQACQHLIDVGGVFSQWFTLITDTMHKKQTNVAPAVVKATAKTTVVAKAKAAKVVKQPKIVKPKAEEEFDIEELKQLADAPY
jgi:hypothetical protein